jgi:hypothetical protein
MQSFCASCVHILVAGVCAKEKEQQTTQTKKKVKLDFSFPSWVVFALTDGE